MRTRNELGYSCPVASTAGPPGYAWPVVIAGLVTLAAGVAAGPDVAEQVREATAHEAAEQAKLFGTSDFREGVSAAAERRPPRFTGS